MDPHDQLNERFNKLHEKLNTINFEVDDSQNTKIDEIYQRVGQVQKDLKETMTDYNQQIVTTISMVRR